MNISDPRNPPRIVSPCVEANFVLNICMPANVIKAKIDDTTNEALVGKAKNTRKQKITDFHF